MAFKDVFGDGDPTPVDQINTAMNQAVAAQEAGEYKTALNKVESAWMRISTLPDSQFEDERLEWDRERIEALMAHLKKRVNQAETEAAAAAGTGGIIRPSEVTYRRG